MRVLLDENFPLDLHRSLVRDGFDAEHLVLGAQRGAAWRRAIDTYLAEQPSGRILEVVLPGVLRPAP